MGLLNTFMDNYKSNSDLEAVAGNLERAKSIIGSVESSKLDLEDATEKVRESSAKVTSHFDKYGNQFNQWSQRAVDDISIYINDRYEYYFAYLNNNYSQKLLNKMMDLYRSVQNGLPKREAHKRFTNYDDRLKSAMAHDVVVMLYLSSWLTQQDPQNTSGNLVVDTDQAMADAKKEFGVRKLNHLNKYEVDYEQIIEDYPVGTESEWFDYIENPVPLISNVP